MPLPDLAEWNSFLTVVSPLQWSAMHIIPLVSSVLQLFAFRELITLGTDRNRYSNPVAWVMFPLVSISIAIAMFSIHCYHFYLGTLVFITSGLLAMLVFYDCTENKMVAENEHRHRNTNQPAQPLESADNDPKSWKQIL